MDLGLRHGRLSLVRIKFMKCMLAGARNCSGANRGQNKESWLPTDDTCENDILQEHYKRTLG